MEPITGPGLAPLKLSNATAPSRPPEAREPSGYLVEVEPAVRIHFLDWGGPDVLGRQGGADVGAPDGGPGVLLVHGLAETGWTWARVARRLVGSAHVVAMDLRGHGLSDAPMGGYDADGLAADAIAVAEGAGLLGPQGDPPSGADVSAGGAGDHTVGRAGDQTVGRSEHAGGRLVIAGIGFGAIVAAAAAARLGNDCAGLVLVDGGWETVGAEGGTVDEWLAAIEEPPEVLASMPAWLADRAAFDAATWDDDQLRAARAQVVETAAGHVKLAVRPHVLRASVAAMLAYQAARVLPAVRATVVALITRDADGRRGAALAEVGRIRLAAGRSAVRFAAFPTRGHNLARHEPDAVAAAILAAAGGAGLAPLDPARRGVAGGDASG